MHITHNKLRKTHTLQQISACIINFRYYLVNQSIDVLLQFVQHLKDNDYIIFNISLMI